MECKREARGEDIYMNHAPVDAGLIKCPGVD